MSPHLNLFFAAGASPLQSIMKHRCNVCDKIFSTAELKIHSRTHTEKKPFVCTKLEMSVSQLDNLTTHYRYHTGEKPYACTQCEKRYTKSGNLKIHIRTHTGEKPFACSICAKQFISSYQLNTHIQRHNKNINCPHCGKKYSHKKELENHVQSTHMKITFNCTQCDRVSKSERSLKEHLRFIHEHKGKKHICIVCDKVFISSYKLKIHIRRHTGERPFVCVQCNKSFPKECSLKRHTRCHTYKCKIAPQSNTRVKRHTEICTNRIIYNCTHCKETFYTKKAKLKHEYNHKPSSEEGEIDDIEDGEIIKQETSFLI